MKKRILIPLIILLALLSIFYLRPFITGRAIETEEDLKAYLHTKAICNNSNFCQDYEITCNGNTLVKTQPITGAIVQHPKDWKDPRENPEILCE